MDPGQRAFLLRIGLLTLRLGRKLQLEKWARESMEELERRHDALFEDYGHDKISALFSDLITIKARTSAYNLAKTNKITCETAHKIKDAIRDLMYDEMLPEVE